MAKIYLLSNQKYSGVENLEVFHIEYIKSNIDLSFYDALIFTSKNAVYSLDSFNKNWKEIDSYVIAPKTSQVIESLGGKVVFTGITSHGNEFAKELISLLKDKKVLYIKDLFVNNQLIRGSHFNAGEVGHTNVGVNIGIKCCSYLMIWYTTRTVSSRRRLFPPGGSTRGGGVSPRR